MADKWVVGTYRGGGPHRGEVWISIWNWEGLKGIGPVNPEGPRV